MKSNNRDYLLIGASLAGFGIITIIAGVSTGNISPVVFAYLVILVVGLFFIHKSITIKNRLKSTADINDIKKKLEDKQQEYDSACADFELKLEDMNNKFTESGFDKFETAQKELADISAQVAEAVEQKSKLQSQIEQLNSEADLADKRAKTSTNKAARLHELCNALTYMLKKQDDIPDTYFNVKNFTEQEITELCPTVEMKIHSMDVRDLQKEFRSNDKRIDELTKSYSSRYTTKANKALYILMVIALRAELQNILYDLKYQKLDQGIENVKSMTAKYLQIACDGNQSIAPTMVKFIGEIEYLFITSVKIEYDYYVRKEQARQEQLAIREQMRQEAEERKALEAERKKVEHEEQKFKNQIDDVNEKLRVADETEAGELRKRLLELEAQLSNIVIKKENIVNLQNGKAGNVYIISNLGSFGENVFKIGMTRRLDPQERVDELGSASVPFGFDVHSFIFSDDAVGLENELHKRLNERRVNKVNMRKEFFNVSLDELEALTREISPTSEFRRTMAAEEYRQSISCDTNYEDVDESDDEDDDLDDE